MKTKYPIMIAGDNFGCGSSREVMMTHLKIGAIPRNSNDSLADIVVNPCLTFPTCCVCSAVVFCFWAVSCRCSIALNPPPPPRKNCDGDTSDNHDRE